jgi:hypothetical protein
MNFRMSFILYQNFATPGAEAEAFFSKNPKFADGIFGGSIDPGFYFRGTIFFGDAANAEHWNICSGFLIVFGGNQPVACFAESLARNGQQTCGATLITIQYSLFGYFCGHKNIIITMFFTMDLADRYHGICNFFK